MIDKQEITLFDAVTPVAITSSTDATPIVVTATAHGFVTGDRVLIIGHTTNIAANGIYKVTKLTADTFSLQDELTGANAAGTGAGAGASGIAVKAPPVINVEQFRNIILQTNTGGTATTTIKFAGSSGKPNALAQTSPRYDYPNFAATVNAANPYSFLQLINLDTAAAINGGTGLVVAGADVNVQHEVNVNAMKYFTAFPISWTQGSITMKAILTSNA